MKPLSFVYLTMPSEYCSHMSPVFRLNEMSCGAPIVVTVGVSSSTNVPSGVYFLTFSSGALAFCSRQTQR